MRCFIAVTPSDALLRAVKKVQRELAETIPDSVARWVDTSRMHLTLKFLGDIDERNLEPLKRGVALACAATAPFSLGLHQTGAFPSLRKPNVIWIGISGQQVPLKELQQRIETHTSAYSAHEEKRRCRVSSWVRGPWRTWN